VVALGLLWGEHAYLQSSWNVLDGLLVLVSLVDIIVAMASAGGAKILGILRVLRLLRTLRPLRWVWRSPAGIQKRPGSPALPLPTDTDSQAPCSVHLEDARLA
jgi:hypothetical protein